MPRPLPACGGHAWSGVWRPPWRARHRIGCTPAAGRGGRGAPDRPGLLQAAGRARALDAAPAGRRVRAACGGRGRLGRDGAADLAAHASQPWRKEHWCLPPAASAAFVWPLEDVRDVDRRPSDPERPLICRDETSRQVLGAVRAPLPPAPGRPARRDPEYARGGVVTLLLGSEPVRGRRRGRRGARRTRIDCAPCRTDLGDVHSPDAGRLVLVLDQRNTHSPAALDAAVPPGEAQRLADPLEIPDTPAPGSRRNMAAIALRALARQCLHRGLGDRVTLEREVAAWAAARRTSAGRADDARRLPGENARLACPRYINRDSYITRPTTRRPCRRTLPLPWDGR